MKKLLLIIFIILCEKNVNAQWQQTNGPYGGNVSDIIVNGSTLFSSTVGGGIFKSIDNGNSWSKTDSGLTNIFVNSLESCGNKLFAGTHSGIFYSTDNGISWNSTNINTGYEITSIETNDSIFFSGTSTRGIIVSVDSGITWNAAINSGLPYNSLTSSYYYIKAIASYNNNWFASVGGNGGGVLYSTDRGNSWTQRNTGLTNLMITSFAILDSNVFAATFGGGVFVTSNNGNNWVAVNNGLTELSVLTLAKNGDTLFAGTDSGGVFVSNNHGGNWTPVNNGLDSSIDIRSIAVNDSNLFVGTSRRGIFISNNYGWNWYPSNSGIINHFTGSLLAANGKLFAGISSGGFNSNADGYIGAGSIGEGISISSDTGQNWTAMNAILTDFKINCFAVIDTNLFAGTNGGVFRSTDFGITWSAINTGLTNLQITSLIVAGNNIFAGGYGKIFLSTDFGTNWTSVSSGLNPFYQIRALAVKGTDLYAGTNGQGIFKSVDNGTNWTLLNSYWNYTAAICLAVSGSNILAGSVSLGIRLSADDGTSWSLPTVGGYIYCISVDGNNLFVGTPNGAFVSTNNGLSWGAININGLMDQHILSITTDSINLYVGTAGCGTFFIPLTQVVGINDLINQENQKVFPNPFRSLLTVQLTRNEISEFILYDIFSRTIFQEKFINSITLNTEQLASGVYIYEVRYKNEVISKGKVVRQ